MFMKCGRGGEASKRKKGKRKGGWREGERAAEPGDTPLMPPFHDTRFGYHALIGQIS